MHYLFIFFVITQCIVSINSESIRNKLKSYFDGENFASFQKYWQGHRKSFENAVLLALKDSYGRRDMNVYIRRSAEVGKLAEGLHFSDNVVEILLYNLRLVKMPQLTSPEVTFALASNVLRIESSLNKIIVESQYTLFRNSSTMATDNNQDPYKISPFTFQQVNDYGLLTIVAEGCTLGGYIIARLSGLSVNLGYDTFRVTDCEFHVEITNYNSKSPPVIVPYFDERQRIILESLLARTLRQEIIPILQATMFSYVNTSLIFGSSLRKYLKPQTKIFEDTSKYLKHIVRGANKETISRNKAAIELPPIVISWNYTSLPASVWNYIKISNTSVYGTDSLYSAHNGGPFKLQEIKIAETLRFNTLMVRGNFYYENNTVKGEHDYVVEIRDVHVNFEQGLDSKHSLSFEVASWRTAEISIIELEKHIDERKTASALISGYLINVIPEVLRQHLFKIFAQNDLDKNTNDNQNTKSESEDDNGGGGIKEANKGDSTTNLKKAAVLLAMASVMSHKKDKLEEGSNTQDSDEKDKSETQDVSVEDPNDKQEVANRDSNEKSINEASSEKDKFETHEKNAEAQQDVETLKNYDGNGRLLDKPTHEGDKENSLSEGSAEGFRRKISSSKATYKRNTDKDNINEIRK